MINSPKFTKWDYVLIYLSIFVGSFAAALLIIKTLCLIHFL